VISLPFWPITCAIAASWPVGVSANELHVAAVLGHHEIAVGRDLDVVQADRIGVDDGREVVEHRDRGCVDVVGPDPVVALRREVDDLVAADDPLAAVEGRPARPGSGSPWSRSSGDRER